MSVPASPAKRHSVKLTPREIETAIAALQNPRGGEIKLNYVGMAETLGLKNDKVAAASWCALRKKLFSDGKDARPKVARKARASDVNGITKKSPPKNGSTVRPSTPEIVTSGATTTTTTTPGTTPASAIKVEDDSPP